MVTPGAVEIRRVRPSGPPRSAGGRSPRWTGLDGLRGIAILSVVLYHASLNWPRRLSWVQGGFIGVDVFFVLSGYLITAVLLSEHQRRGSISITRFYCRRFLRLFPGLAVLLSAALLWARWDPSPLSAATRDAVPAAGLYYMNWKLIFTSAGQGLLVHTWSLAIEDQFYVLWPVLLIALLAVGGGREVRVGSVVIAAAISAGACAALWNGAHPLRSYAGLDTRAFELLTGCALALWILGDPAGPGRAPRRVSAAAGWIGILSILAMVHFATGAGPVMYRGGFAAVAIAAAASVLAVVRHPHGSLNRVLSVRPLRYCGTISYSLYLWHYAILDGFVPSRIHPVGPGLTIAIQIALSFVMAALSYHLIERRFLRLKDRVHSLSPGRVLRGRPRLDRNEIRERA